MDDGRKLPARKATYHATQPLAYGGHPCENVVYNGAFEQGPRRHGGGAVFCLRVPLHVHRAGLRAACALQGCVWPWRCAMQLPAFGQLVYART